MEEEILTGGRVTAQVVRRGEFVHRTPCKNAAFVHQVLEFLEAGGVEGVPRYRGLDQQGREVLTFLPGQVPPDLGFFTQAQCCQAVERMKAFHSCLRDFPGCPPGWTVCHNDLSPCNYVFQEGRPVGIIDWDAAAFGHPWTTWPTPCGCGWIWAMRSTATPPFGSAWASCWTPTAWPPGSALAWGSASTARWSGWPKACSPPPSRPPPPASGKARPRRA